jgi:transglutaminase-like putative cysteine protease
VDAYLRATEIVDWHDPAIERLARELAADTPFDTAKRCFEWVRDQIRHSHDYQLNPVTLRASDVLREGTGYCYAKSHLLAALLRANSIPAGFCYQRLTAYDEGQYSLHGLNAVYLPEFGWYRIDARGNKPGVNAQFVPPVEQTAFQPSAAGEADFGAILAEPLPLVISALRSCATWDQMAQHLPDVGGALVAEN